MAYAATIRDQVRQRDGHCRIAKDYVIALRAGYGAAIAELLLVIGPCGGFSEWAHLGEFRRFKTRKQEPEDRHSTQHTAMLCGAHHDAYDANRFVIDELTKDGADGPLAYRLR